MKGVSGYYHDRLTNSQGGILWESGWRSNLIVNRCNLLLAALMKRQSGMQGILYLGIGEGKDDWESNPPVPSFTAFKLYREIARQSVGEDKIRYLDNENAPSEVPTKRLKITAELKGEEFASNGYQPIREFGLFGGEATKEPDSGFMINYVIHPRIDLTPGMTLTRKLHLSFRDAALQYEELGGFGAELPVRSIDGIGKEYGTDFERAGIHSIGELSMLDPYHPIGNIPQVKLWEFRAKARILMGLRASLEPLIPFREKSISAFLKTSPEVLIESIESRDITLEMVKHLQERLAPLQVALDDLQLQDITLGDLITA